MKMLSMNQTKNKMKIAIIFPKDSSAIFDPHSTETFGGATVQMFLLAKELSNYINLDISSFVVEFGRKNGEIVNGLKIYNMFHINDILPMKILKFHRLIQKIKPDIIIQHGLTIFSCLLAVYCKIFGIKFVYMFAHDVEADGYYQTSRKKAHLIPLLIKYANVIIVQNIYQYNKINRLYGRKTNILYNGFPIVKNYTDNKKHILWVARCDVWKKPEKFIKLASLNSQYKFIMVCNEGKDLDYFNHIQKLASGVKNLDFLSHVPTEKLNEIFKNSLIFVNTSDDEGFPQVFIQATMNKVPIVSLNVNPDNFITKYECGIFCEGDEVFMSESIQCLLNNSKRYDRISTNAYNYAKENHDIVKNVEKLIKIISGYV